MHHLKYNEFLRDRELKRFRGSSSSSILVTLSTEDIFCTCVQLNVNRQWEENSCQNVYAVVTKRATTTFFRGVGEGGGNRHLLCTNTEKCILVSSYKVSHRERK